MRPVASKLGWAEPTDKRQGLLLESPGMENWSSIHSTQCEWLFSCSSFFFSNQTRQREWFYTNLIRTNGRIAMIWPYILQLLIYIFRQLSYAVAIYRGMFEFVIFGRLCGSTNYYWASGVKHNLWKFARCLILVLFSVNTIALILNHSVLRT